MADHPILGIRGRSHDRLVRRMCVGSLPGCGCWTDRQTLYFDWDVVRIVDPCQIMVHFHGQIGYVDGRDSIDDLELVHRDRQRRGIRRTIRVVEDRWLCGGEGWSSLLS